MNYIKKNRNELFVRILSCCFFWVCSFVGFRSAFFLVYCFTSSDLSYCSWFMLLISCVSLLLVSLRFMFPSSPVHLSLSLFPTACLLFSLHTCILFPILYLSIGPEIKSTCQYLTASLSLTPRCFLCLYTLLSRRSCFLSPPYCFVSSCFIIIFIKLPTL